MKVPLRRSLGTLGLVSILYFNVSGGPFTTETLVHETGPATALLLIVLVPLLWSLPETLIIGELASMLPEEGGYYRWVQRAFGRFWAFQNGWITWMYSLVDMALYPLLFIQYLQYFLPHLPPQSRWILALAIIWGATLLNLRGSFEVGRASILTASFVVGTFLLLALASVPHASHMPWAAHGAGSSTSGLAVGLAIALWNYIGWDNPSTVAGEVRDAGRAYPRALFITLPLVTLGYLVPLLAALAASDWRTWVDGGWPQIAIASAGRLGPLLAGLVAVAGMVSALSLFNALLLSYSRIPLVLAMDGFLPRTLARTDPRGTPRNAVLVAAAVYSVAVLVPFGRLIIADVLLYAFALMLEFGALVALRGREPALRGPFRIPVGRAGVIALASLPLAGLVVAVFISFRDGEYGLPAALGALAVTLLGVVAYGAVRARPG